MKNRKMTTISHVNWQSLSRLTSRLTFDRSFAMAATTLSPNLIRSQQRTKMESLKQGHSRRRFSKDKPACLPFTSVNRLTLKPLSFPSRMPPWVPRLSVNTNKSSIRWRMQSSRLAPLTSRLLRAKIAEVALVIVIARKILSRILKPNASNKLHLTSVQKLEDVKGQRNNSVISQMRKFSAHQHHSAPAKCPLTSSLRQLRLRMVVVLRKSKSLTSSSCHRVVSVRAYPWNLNSRLSARLKPTHLEPKRCLTSARHKRASSHHRRKNSQPSKNSTWQLLTEAKTNRLSFRRPSRLNKSRQFRIPNLRPRQLDRQIKI